MEEIKRTLNMGISPVWAIVAVVIVAVLTATAFLAYGYFWAPEPPEGGESKVKNEKSLEETAEIIFTDHLEKFKNQNTALNSRLKDYKINNIDVRLTEENCFRFWIDFSVETYRNENNGITGWDAGNGDVDGPWIVNKLMFVDVIKDENENYGIREMGTAAGGSCMGDYSAEGIESFCKGNDIMVFSSQMNFDKDSAKEPVLMCGNGLVPNWKPGQDGYFTVNVLDKKNNDYEVVWEKYTGEDGLWFRYVEEPKIVDIDKDGIDELVLSGSNHGGTCTGSFYKINIYSPKDASIYAISLGRGSEGYVSGIGCIYEELPNLAGCGPQAEATCFSDNLGDKQAFKNYLQEAIEEYKNRGNIE